MQGQSNLSFTCEATEIKTVVASKMALDAHTNSPPLLTTQIPHSNTHQVRLREACDGCTAAKVKCDRGRPSCQRCLDSDESCQYSPSRRHGKRARRARRSSLGTPPPPLTSESGLIRPRPPPAGSEASITPHSAVEFAWDNIDSIFTDTEAIPVFPSEHELDLFVNGTSTDLSMLAGFESPDYVSPHDPWIRASDYLQGASRIDHPGNPALNKQTLLVEQEPLIQNETMGTDAVSGPGVEHPRHKIEHALECEARAQTVLRSLQYSPTLCSPDRGESCSTATPTATVTTKLAYTVDSMDTLLATNKAALNELTQLLECRCAKTSHVALLHMTILSKIVFWYNVAVTTRYNSERVELKPMNIQFGVLDLDDDDHATLHRAVLCRELQKAGNAIRAFEVRFATYGVPSRNKESPWGRLIIRALREELERSVHEVETCQSRPFQF